MLYEWISNLPGQFPYAVQLLAAGFIFALPVKKRNYPWLKFFVFAVVFLVAGYFVPDVLVAGFLFIPFIVLIPLAALGFWFILDASAKRILFCIISMTLLQHIAEGVTWVFREIFSVSRGDWIWTLISYICYVILYAGGYFLFIFRKSNDDTVNMKSLKLILVAGGVFVIIYFMREIFLYFFQQQSLYLPLVRMAINLYSVICCILTFIILYSVKRSDSVAVEKQIMQELLRKEQDNYALVTANMDSINYKCHDLKHQIAFLREATSSEDRNNYIDKLEKEIMIYEHTPKTGNSALDATLAHKSLFCAENDIEFTYIADAAKLEFMEPADIYSLVGNAIENAIECVMKYDDKEKRFISMHLSSVGSLVKIYIENYCEDKLEIINGEIKTTKSDSVQHGFGLKSMRYIAEKYKGHINLEQKSNLFIVNIMMPLG